MNQNKQPEALRLADICAKKGLFAVEDELRRLHAESELHMQELRSYRITVESQDARIADLEAQLAAAQQGVQPQETIAYVTRNEEGDPAMLFFDLNEGRLYCNPDEEPEALVLAAGSALQSRDREDAARWRFVAQFMQLDDVGDDQYCLGLIVNYEALEDMVTAQSARLDGERRRLEWADVQGPGDSPRTLPPITLDAAIDAAIAAQAKQGEQA